MKVINPQGTSLPRRAAAVQSPAGLKSGPDVFLEEMILPMRDDRLRAGTMLGQAGESQPPMPLALQPMLCAQM